MSTPDDAALRTLRQRLLAQADERLGDVTGTAHMRTRPTPPLTFAPSAWVQPYHTVTIPVDQVIAEGGSELPLLWGRYALNLATSYHSYRSDLSGDEPLTDFRAMSSGLEDIAQDVGLGTPRTLTAAAAAAYQALQFRPIDDLRIDFVDATPAPPAEEDEGPAALLRPTTLPEEQRLTLGSPVSPDEDLDGGVFEGSVGLTGHAGAGAGAGGDAGDDAPVATSFPLEDDVLVTLDEARVGAVVPILATWLTDKPRYNKYPRLAGIRVPSLGGDAEQRARAVDIIVSVLSGLHERGVFTTLHNPEHHHYFPGAWRLTLASVGSVAEVEAVAELLDTVEEEWGLADAGIRLRIEIEVDSPQHIIGEQGTIMAAKLIDAAEGRCDAVHFGLAGYTAGLGIDAVLNCADHPVADKARDVLQVVCAGKGVDMADGACRRLPAHQWEDILNGWQRHFRLVDRQLRRGIRQGTDIHPLQLITRHLATAHYYREGWQVAAQQLSNYRAGLSPTLSAGEANALAEYLRRADHCLALSDEELRSFNLERDHLHPGHDD